MIRELPHSAFRPLFVPILSVVALLVMGSGPPLRAQGTNLERLQKCAGLVADSVLAMYSSADTLCMTTIEHPASWLLDQSMLAGVERRNLRLGSCGEGATDRLQLAITAIGIEYHEVDDPDSVERRASISVGSALPFPTGSSQRLPGARLSRSYSVVLLDTVNAAGTSSLETPGYPYTHGMLVTNNHPGFWGKIVEPAVILGASVVMVILLFSVRSQ
jgi:hypothetical protein